MRATSRSGPPRCSTSSPLARDPARSTLETSCGGSGARLSESGGGSPSPLGDSGCLRQPPGANLARCPISMLRKTTVVPSAGRGARAIARRSCELIILLSVPSSLVRFILIPRPVARRSLGSPCATTDPNPYRRRAADMFRTPIDHARACTVDAERRRHHLLASQAISRESEPGFPVNRQRCHVPASLGHFCPGASGFARRGRPVRLDRPLPSAPNVRACSVPRAPGFRSTLSTLRRRHLFWFLLRILRPGWRRCNGFYRRSRGVSGGVPANARGTGTNANSAALDSA